MAPRIGLVLGGGGAAAAVFHAAALAEIQRQFDWHPASSAVIQGTSAGALVGLMLRLGVSPADLVAFVSDRPKDAEHPLIRNRTVVEPELDTTAVSMFRNWMRAGVRVRPGSTTSFLELLSAPTRLRPHLHFVDELTDGWTDSEFRVCTVRADDRRVVVWSGSERDVRLADAVAASCSLPGMFSSVTINGDLHVDGGLRSPTNADLMAGEDVDAVLVLSPMTTQGSVVTTPVAWWAKRCLTRERRTLENDGYTTAVLQAPTPVSLATNLPAVGATHRLRLIARIETAVRAQLPDLQDLLFRSETRDRTQTSRSSVPASRSSDDE